MAKGSFSTSNPHLPIHNVHPRSTRAESPSYVSECDLVGPKRIVMFRLYIDHQRFTDHDHGDYSVGLYTGRDGELRSLYISEASTRPAPSFHLFPYLYVSEELQD